MLEHMENIWEKNASLFLTMKEGGGGFFFSTDPKWLSLWGGEGEFSVSFGEIFSSQWCKQL